MKTYKGWEKSDVNLDEYLGYAPCQINEELFNYIVEVVPAQYISREICQGGEPCKHEDDIGFYDTVSYNPKTDKYYYLGILPEFKQ